MTGKHALKKNPFWVDTSDKEYGDFETIDQQVNEKTFNDSPERCVNHNYVIASSSLKSLALDYASSDEDEQVNVNEGNNSSNDVSIQVMNTNDNGIKSNTVDRICFNSSVLDSEDLSSDDGDLKRNYLTRRKAGMPVVLWKNLSINKKCTLLFKKSSVQIKDSEITIIDINSSDDDDVDTSISSYRHRLANNVMKSVDINDIPRPVATLGLDCLKMKECSVRIRKLAACCLEATCQCHRKLLTSSNDEFELGLSLDIQQRSRNIVEASQKEGIKERSKTDEAESRDRSEQDKENNGETLGTTNRRVCVADLNTLLKDGASLQSFCISSSGLGLNDSDDTDDDDDDDVVIVEEEFFGSVPGLEFQSRSCFNNEDKSNEELYQSWAVSPTVETNRIAEETRDLALKCSSVSTENEIVGRSFNSLPEHVEDVEVIGSLRTREDIDENNNFAINYGVQFKTKEVEVRVERCSITKAAALNKRMQNNVQDGEATLSSLDTVCSAQASDCTRSESLNYSQKNIVEDSSITCQSSGPVSGVKFNGTLKTKIDEDEDEASSYRGKIRPQQKKKIMKLSSSLKSFKRFHPKFSTTIKVSKGFQPLKKVSKKFQSFGEALASSINFKIPKTKSKMEPATITKEDVKGKDDLNRQSHGIEAFLEQEDIEVNREEFDSMFDGISAIKYLGSKKASEVSEAVEKGDIDSEGWDSLKSLQTDEDRKRWVQSQFKNTVPSDPGRNLTFHGFRMSRSQRYEGSCYSQENRNKKRVLSELRGTSAKKIKLSVFGSIMKNVFFKKFNRKLGSKKASEADLKAFKIYIGHFKGGLEETTNFFSYYNPNKVSFVSSVLF